MKHIYLIVLNLVGSVLLPIILTHYLVELDTFQQLQIGSAFFLVISIAECLYYIKKVLEDRQRVASVWTAKSEFDGVIKRLRDDCERVIHSRLSEHDILFEDLLMRDLKTLAKTAQQAADENEIPVQDHHFRSHEALAEIFEDSSSRLFRELYILDEESGSIDYVYFNFLKMLEGVSKKPGIKVRTLFIRLEASDFEMSEYIQTLLKFYESTKNFEKLVLDENKLDNLKAEYRVGTDWRDFGIYGNHLIFKTMLYGTNSTEGVFSRHKGEVANCIAFFDKAWSEAEPLTPAQPSKVKLKDIKKFVQ